MNGNKKLLLLELFFNVISFEEKGRIYIIRSSYFDSYEVISHLAYEKICNTIYKESDYYLTQKKVFTIDEIKNTMTLIIKSNEFKSIKEIYLFGSYAKKTNDEYSDVDLLVIFDEESEAIVLSPIIKNLLKVQYEINSDIVPAIEGKLDEFDLHALSYGFVIYQEK